MRDVGMRLDLPAEVVAILQSGAPSTLMVRLVKSCGCRVGRVVKMADVVLVYLNAVQIVAVDLDRNERMRQRRIYQIDDPVLPHDAPACKHSVPERLAVDKLKAQIESVERGATRPGTPFVIDPVP